MLTRKQALLTVALMTGLPLATWAATEAVSTAAPKFRGCLKSIPDNGGQDGYRWR